MIQEREAGGLFGKISESFSSVSPTEADIHEISKSTILSIEERIRLLENLMCNMDQKLNRLSKQREQFDTIILELFKLLTKSMESRWNSLKKFDCLNDHKQIDSGTRIDHDSGPGSLF